MAAERVLCCSERTRAGCWVFLMIGVKSAAGDDEATFFNNSLITDSLLIALSVLPHHLLQLNLYFSNILHIELIQ